MIEGTLGKKSGGSDVVAGGTKRDIYLFGGLPEKASRSFHGLVGPIPGEYEH